MVNSGGKLRYSERGGQTYARLSHAQERLDLLRARGVECELYESEPVVWRKVSAPVVMEGQEALPFD